MRFRTSVFMILVALPSLVAVAEEPFWCDEMVFDDDSVANAFFYLSDDAVLARRFEGAFSPVAMEWGEINTVSYGEPFFPWPDTTYDSIEISIWEEEPGTGLPRHPPIWTTFVTPSDSPPDLRVYPPDTVLAATNMIFLGMRNPDTDNCAEGLCVDGRRDFEGLYYSMDGGLSWDKSVVYGDWHIRACLKYPGQVQEETAASRPRLALGQPAPNPFTNRTTLAYSVPSDMSLRLGVYDSAGRRIRILVDHVAPAGSHTAAWDGLDEAGDPVPSGVYLCRLETPGEMLVRKVVLFSRAGTPR